MYVCTADALFFPFSRVMCFSLAPSLAGATCNTCNNNVNDDGDRSHEAVLIHDGRRGARGSLGGFSLAGGDGLNNTNSTRGSTAAGGWTQSRPNSGSGGVTGGGSGSGAG